MCQDSASSRGALAQQEWITSQGGIKYLTAEPPLEVKAAQRPALAHCDCLSSARYQPL